ncbi:hypothetical protein, partial [Actinocorallia aurea]
ARTERPGPKQQRADTITAMSTHTEDTGSARTLEAKPDPSEPRGAIIEIIQKRRGRPTGDLSEEVIVPSDVRLNGQSILTPYDSPVRIHEVTFDGGECVLVTLTVYARRILVDAEYDEPPTT